MGQQEFDVAKPTESPHATVTLVWPPASRREFHASLPGAQDVPTDAMSPIVKVVGRECLVSRVRSRKMATYRLSVEIAICTGNWDATVWPQPKKKSGPSAQCEWSAQILLVAGARNHLNLEFFLGCGVAVSQDFVVRILHLAAPFSEVFKVGSGKSPEQVKSPQGPSACAVGPGLRHLPLSQSSGPNSSSPGHRGRSGRVSR